MNIMIISASGKLQSEALKQRTKSLETTKKLSFSSQSKGKRCEHALDWISL